MSMMRLGKLENLTGANAIEGARHLPILVRIDGNKEGIGPWWCNMWLSHYASLSAYA